MENNECKTCCFLESFFLIVLACIIIGMIVVVCYITKANEYYRGITYLLQEEKVAIKAVSDKMYEYEMNRRNRSWYVPEWLEEKF